MKYEIMNPSDKCYFESDNEKAACVCCLFLGMGKYGLHNAITGESVLPVFILGGTDDWLSENIGDCETFVKDNRQAMIDCFASFSYDKERTSLNNIGERAKTLEKAFSDK